MRAYLGLIFALSLMCLNKPVLAHQLSTAYLNLSLQPESIEGNWQIRVRDLEHYILFDLPNKHRPQEPADGMIFWHEIMAKTLQVTNFTRKQLSIRAGGDPCPLVVDPQLQLDRHFNQPYLVISFEGNCSPDEHISLNYQAFFDKDARHKAIVTVKTAGQNISRVLSQNNREQRISLKQTSLWQTFCQYLYQGVIHIWLGTDHILFLLVLLLTICFSNRKYGISDKRPQQISWQAITDKKIILWQSAGLVTAFTLAHSITLTATALGWSWLPSAYVEGIIALSVLFTALNNVYPMVIRLGWLTFVFGLFHGMGFASVLTELGLAPDRQLLSILSFNLGVELGQLVILVVILPLLMALRFKAWYGKYLIPTASAAIALIAMQWTVERFFP